MCVREGGSMKLLHTADLHIGKIVNEFSMLQDQKHILQQILTIAKEEQVDGVIIAGDVYDRSIPPAEAVTMLDWFLSALISQGIKVFMISGNHDSAERVGFASSILCDQGLYIGGIYDGTIQRVRLEKDEVRVDIYLLPFVKPQVVSYYEKAMQEEGQESEIVIRTYEEAVRASISHMELDPDVVNVLVTHHYVTSGGIEPEVSESETTLSLGGIDKVDASVFDSFDYVALGHIHGPQRMGRDTIRYAGSPLKYSFSEVNHHKSVTLISIGQDKQIAVEQRRLKPLHDMRKIKGKLKDLMNPEYYSLEDTNDYVHVTLTDEVELVDPIGTLRSVYPNVMQIVLEKNQKKENQAASVMLGQRKSKSPLELFGEFYRDVTGLEFDEKRSAIMSDIIEKVTGGEQE